MKPTLVAALCGLVLAACGSGGLDSTSATDTGYALSPPPTEITVMTRNLYYGSELDEAIAAVVAGDPEQIVLAVAEVWARVQATDFPTRARALADEIEEAAPHLIGLQEAALWRTQYPADPETPAETVAYDFVEILQAELAARGLKYDVAAEFVGFDAEFPRITEAYDLEDIRLTDREVILVNRNCRWKVKDALTGAFGVNIVLPNGFEITRGWAAVDVKTGHRELRIVSTHLEADHPDVRLAQAAEILEGPTVTDLPVVLVGDLNSDANDPEAPEYALCLDAGFDDVALEPSGDDGNTCCHDEELVDPAADLTERIDFVFVRGEIVVYEVATYGAAPEEMVDGLWASDHAAVAATIALR